MRGSGHVLEHDRWMTHPDDVDYLAPADRWCRVCGLLDREHVCSTCGRRADDPYRNGSEGCVDPLHDAFVDCRTGALVQVLALWFASVWAAFWGVVLIWWALRSFRAVSQVERLDPHAELAAIVRGCFCPDDCGCHYPWRFNACGCRAHGDGLVDVAEDGQVSLGVAGEQMPLEGLAAIRVGLEG